VGRDLGRYKDSPLHDWFEHLASGKGLCCSFADGYVVEDADWQTTADGKHYRVRVPLSAGSIQMNWVYAGQHDLTIALPCKRFRAR
jgi:hypothetical protein